MLPKAWPWKGILGTEHFHWQESRGKTGTHSTLEFTRIPTCLWQPYPSPIMLPHKLSAGIDNKYLIIILHRKCKIYSSLHLSLLSSRSSYSITQSTCPPRYWMYIFDEICLQLYLLTSFPIVFKWISKDHFLNAVSQRISNPQWNLSFLGASLLFTYTHSVIKSCQIYFVNGSIAVKGIRPPFLFRWNCDQNLLPGMSIINLLPLSLALILHCLSCESVSRIFMLLLFFFFFGKLAWF